VQCTVIVMYIVVLITVKCYFFCRRK